MTLSDFAGNTALAQVNHRIRTVRTNDCITGDRMAATIAERIENLTLVLTDRLREALAALRTMLDPSAPWSIRSR